MEIYWVDVDGGSRLVQKDGDTPGRVIVFVEPEAGKTDFFTVRNIYERVSGGELYHEMTAAQDAGLAIVKTFFKDPTIVTGSK